MDWLKAVLEVFRDSGYVALLTFGMALASLIVAIAAWISSSRTSRRLIQIEQGRDQLAARKAKKAQLTAAVLNPKRHTYHLHIVNDGEGQARNIRITLDGRPLFDHPAMPSGQEERQQIGPKSAFKYLLAPSLSTPTPTSIRIEWDDDSGDDGVYESGL